MNITHATNRGLWYFAHPYTAKDRDGHYVPGAEDANYWRATIRAAHLIEAGYNIYSPITHTHPIHRASARLQCSHEHELWYQLDNEFIDKTRWAGIILAPGWKDSEGCKAEKKRFEEKGLQVMYMQDMNMSILPG